MVTGGGKGRDSPPGGGELPPSPVCTGEPASAIAWLRWGRFPAVVLELFKLFLLLAWPCWPLPPGTAPHAARGPHARHTATHATPGGAADTAHLRQPRGTRSAGQIFDLPFCAPGMRLEAWQAGSRGEGISFAPSVGGVPWERRGLPLMPHVSLRFTRSAGQIFNLPLAPLDPSSTASHWWAGCGVRVGPPLRPTEP